MTIDIGREAGDFAEDKDAAARLRREEIEPALARNEDVILDFGTVSLTTQSFVHALVSAVLRARGETVLDRLAFKGCNRGVQGLVRTVVEYSLQAAEEA